MYSPQKMSSDIEYAENIGHNSEARIPTAMFLLEVVKAKALCGIAESLSALVEIVENDGANVNVRER